MLDSTVVNCKSHFRAHPEEITQAIRELLPNEALELIAA